MDRCCYQRGCGDRNPHLRFHFPLLTTSHSYGTLTLRLYDIDVTYIALHCIALHCGTFQFQRGQWLGYYFFTLHESIRFKTQDSKTQRLVVSSDGFTSAGPAVSFCFCQFRLENLESLTIYLYTLYTISLTNPIRSNLKIIGTVQYP